MERADKSVRKKSVLSLRNVVREFATHFGRIRIAFEIHHHALHTTGCLFPVLELIQISQPGLHARSCFVIYILLNSASPGFVLAAEIGTCVKQQRRSKYGYRNAKPRRNFFQSDCSVPDMSFSMTSDATIGKSIWGCCHGGHTEFIIQRK